MRFTRAGIEALTVPQGKAQVIVWDEALKGFGVKLNQGGTRQWVCQYRTPDGRSPRVTIGRVDAVNLDEARRQARLILARAQTGQDPQAEKAAARAAAAVTLGSVSDAYLTHAQRRLKRRSYQEVERHLHRAWEPLRDRPIALIRRADVAARLNVLAETGPINAIRARSALSAVFTWAIGEGIAESNPTAGTNKPAEEKSRDRVLTEPEIRAIWRTCRDDDYGVLIRLLLLTGQRREEVGAMDESELDLDAGMWVIPSARTKNKLTHEVPLSPAAVALIRKKPRLVGRSLIFGTGNGPFSGWSNSKERLDSRITKSGETVAPWRLHDLRRTCATLMAEKLKVQPHVIEAVLNHVSGSRAGVAGIYNRASYRDEKRDALDRWAAYVADLLRPTESPTVMVRALS